MMDTTATSPAQRGHGSRSAGSPNRANAEKLAAVADSSPRRHTGLLGFAVGVLIAVAVAFLIAQNTRSVPLSWLWFDADGPVWVVLALAFIAGLIVGPLTIASVRLAQSRRQDRLNLIEDARS